MSNNLMGILLLVLFFAGLAVITHTGKKRDLPPTQRMPHLSLFYGLVAISILAVGLLLSHA